jgi:hypothetical protein
MAPFVEGDLVYLSTKNINFPKGLARKLIPKYIGPYKIIRDFKNQSFEIELPSYLKQRGVHNVYHASLLRIHVPNDDRLFPGRLDSQITSENSTEPEWAVDKILSHSGSKEDALFEVQWKAGDVTWLPYHQIEHLNALSAYFEVMGIEKITDLPRGTGKPPIQDPQIFVGSISLSVPHFSYKTSTSPRCFLPSVTPPDTQILTTPLASLRTSSSLSLDMSEQPMAPPPSNDASPAATFVLRTFNHPDIRRISRITIALTIPITNEVIIYHVGQIMTFLLCDARLRNGRRTTRTPGGYAEFALAFNSNNITNNQRFAVYDFLTNQIITEGEPMDATLWHIDHNLIGWSQPENSNSNHTLSDKRQRIVNDLLWSQAERHALREEYIQKKRDSKKRTRVPAPPSFPFSSNFPDSFFDDNSSPGAGSSTMV